MDNITVTLATIWYFIRDYSTSIYPLKTVQNVAVEQLTREGYKASVYPGKRGIIQVNGETYKIYRIRTWNRYDVQHIIL
jgi:hypothetical protein